MTRTPFQFSSSHRQVAWPRRVYGPVSLRYLEDPVECVLIPAKLLSESNAMDWALLRAFEIRVNKRMSMASAAREVEVRFPEDGHERDLVCEIERYTQQLKQYLYSNKYDRFVWYLFQKFFLVFVDITIP